MIWKKDLNNAEDVFKEIVRERSQVATSSHRSAGIKPLDKDYTRKDYNNMSGTVYSYKKNSPMSYDYFKALPKHLQKEYLQHIVDTYNVGSSAIAYMFGLDKSFLSLTFRKLGVEKSTRRTSNASRDKFYEEFLGCSIQPRVVPKTDATVEDVSNIKFTAAIPVVTDYTEITGYSYTGPLDIELITTKLREKFTSGTKISIHIETITNG